MASIENSSTRSFVGANWRAAEVRTAELRHDSARRDEERAERRAEDAERDLERAQRRFDRYA